MVRLALIGVLLLGLALCVASPQIESAGNAPAPGVPITRVAIQEMPVDETRERVVGTKELEEVAQLGSAESSSELPTGTFWPAVLEAADSALYTHGTELFRGSQLRPFLRSLDQIELSRGRPIGPPAVEWVEQIASPETRGLVVALVARYCNAEWEPWAAELQSQPAAAGVERIGYLYGGLLRHDGTASLSSFARAFKGYYRFLPGRIARPSDTAVAFAGRVLGDIDQNLFSREPKLVVTEQSLAACVLASRYEESQAVRARLEAVLNPRIESDGYAHAGAVFGLASFGGHLAALRLQKLLESPVYSGRHLLLAWASELLEGTVSAVDLLPPANDPYAPRVAKNTTRAALEALKRGANPELLDELLRRSLDREDHSIDRLMLALGLVDEGVDPEAGIYLFTELSYQEPEPFLQLFFTVPEFLMVGRSATPDALALYESSLEAIGRDLGEDGALATKIAHAHEQLAAMR